jgi:hypothetical protein
MSFSPGTLKRNERLPAIAGMPHVDDLLIREAKRRHRRRLLLIAAVFVVFGSSIGLGISSLTSGSAHRIGTKPKSSRTPPPPAAAPGACSPSQLTASVVFNQTGADLGAIKLTNTAAHPCSLAGQPKVDIIDGAGAGLSLDETIFQRAGLPPASTHPIILTADGRSPQAIIEFDWTWCGSPPGALQFSVAFSKWQSVLTVPNSEINPQGFAPADCSDSGGHSLFAVDDVRSFGDDGIEP